MLVICISANSFQNGRLRITHHVIIKIANVAIVSGWYNIFFAFLVISTFNNDVRINKAKYGNVKVRYGLYQNALLKSPKKRDIIARCNPHVGQS